MKIRLIQVFVPRFLIKKFTWYIKNKLNFGEKSHLNLSKKGYFSPLAKHVDLDSSLEVTFFAYGGSK